MHTLSMTTGYAVQALSILAQHPDKFVLVRDIAHVTGIPAPYLSKVTQRLVDVGLLDSKRGYFGGIRLLRSPKEISILQIDEAVDMGGSRANCLLGTVECNDDRACPLHDYWKKTKAEIRNRLSSLTLADLAEFEAARHPVVLPGPAPKKRSKKRVARKVAPAPKKAKAAAKAPAKKKAPAAKAPAKKAAKKSAAKKKSARATRF